MNKINSITHAFKEWETAIKALEAGKTIMLLRKGGIHERGGKFQVSHEQVLLYPTYEHQQSSMIKPEYTQGINQTTSDCNSDKLCISSWAKITDILPVDDESIINSLTPFHVWKQNFISDRLKWKPSRPLYILLLRVYKLPQIQYLPYLPKYGGCKSWIELTESIDISNTKPVIYDSTYSQIVDKIRSMVDK
ncbi:MAG: DUF1802 family protein [Cyanobacteria bacterium P01_A01_bin.84]